MVSMRKPDIRLLDMSVLLVFQELMLRRKAVSVAEKLNLTQSAISYSLNRLRQFFEDPLFVRTPTGMTPTPVAFELAPRIDAILEQTRALSARGSDDDPASWTGTLRVGVQDSGCAVFGGQLVAMLNDWAPNLSIALESAAGADALAKIVRGDLDLAFGVFASVTERLEMRRVHRQRLVTICRADHPIVTATDRLEAFTTAGHLAVTDEGGSTDAVERAVRELGSPFRVSATTPFFLGAIPIVRASDLLCTLPADLAESWDGVVQIDPPVRLPAAVVSCVSRVGSRTLLRDRVVDHLRHELSARECRDGDNVANFERRPTRAA